MCGTSIVRRDLVHERNDLVDVRAQCRVIEGLLRVRELFLENILDKFRLPIRAHFSLELYELFLGEAPETCVEPDMANMSNTS